MSKANTPASRKAKGRRASAELREILLRHAEIRKYGLSADDIIVKPGGVIGEDLYLSPLARKIFPFVFENKNTERMDVWGAIRQAESHARGTMHVPIVAFKRNGEPLRFIIDAEKFLELMEIR